MRKVYTALNLPDAHLVMHLLRQQGIDARVFNENAASALGEIPVSAAQPQVWVMDQSMAARALSIIDAFTRQRASGVVHACSKCGEQNPQEFEICWNCGWALPASD